MGISAFVKKYKKGLNVRVHKDFDSDGFEPSGGVAQKIAISRAIYKDTPIIILDEPTAALDPKSESEIYEQFNKLSKISWLFLFHIEWHRQGFVITLLFLRMEALKKWVVIMN